MKFEQYLNPEPPLCPVCKGEMIVTEVHGFAPFAEKVFCECACGVKVQITIPIKEREQ